MGTCVMLAANRVSPWTSLGQPHHRGGTDVSPLPASLPPRCHACIWRRGLLRGMASRCSDHRERRCCGSSQCGFQKHP